MYFSPSLDFLVRSNFLTFLEQYITVFCIQSHRVICMLCMKKREDAKAPVSTKVFFGISLCLASHTRHLILCMNSMPWIAMNLFNCNSNSNSLSSSFFVSLCTIIESNQIFPTIRSRRAHRILSRPSQLKAMHWKYTIPRAFVRKTIVGIVYQYPEFSPIYSIFPFVLTLSKPPANLGALDCIILAEI